MQNIIIDNLVLYDKKDVSQIENSKYDEKLGLWLWNDGEVLVKSRDSNCPIRASKKKDIETGEDLKGE